MTQTLHACVHMCVTQTGVERGPERGQTLSSGRLVGRPGCEAAACLAVRTRSRPEASASPRQGAHTADSGGATVAKARPRPSRRFPTSPATARPGSFPPAVAPGGPAGPRGRASGCPVPGGCVPTPDFPASPRQARTSPRLPASRGTDVLAQRAGSRVTRGLPVPAARSPPPRPAHPWPAWPRTCGTSSSGCPTPSSCCTSPSSSARCTCRAWRRSWTSQVRHVPAAARSQAAFASGAFSEGAVSPTG